jgi:serine O-acetyltransferase
MECALALEAPVASVSWGKLLRCYLYDSGFRVLFLYRLARYLHLRFSKTRVLWNLTHIVTQHAVKVGGAYISPCAQIGEDCRIFYGTGMVIGPHVTIGRDAVILNGITIGNVHPSKAKQPAVIGDNVYLGAGCRILGEVTLGDNVRIGANAVVLQSCGSDVTLVGIPARAVAKSGPGAQEGSVNSGMKEA